MWTVDPSASRTSASRPGMAGQSRGSWGSSPCSGKTALRVARIARSTASGSPDGCHGVHCGAMPSVIVTGTSRLGRRRCARFCQASGVGRGRVDRLTGRDRQQVGPGPRYRLDDRVPAAARWPPSARRTARRPGPAAPGTSARWPSTVSRRSASGSSRCPSAPHWVNSDLRPERPQHRRDDRVEGPQPAGVAGTGRQRDVHRATLRARAAGLGREAGTGEQRQRRLVQAHGQYPRDRR